MPFFIPRTDPRVKIANEESAVTINNQDTLESITNLTISGLKASTRYSFMAFVRMTSPATADIQFDLSLPSGASKQWGEGDTPSTDFSGLITIATTGSAQLAILIGQVAVSTTSGSAVLQFRQLVATVGDTTIGAGSWVMMMELPGGSG